MKILHVFDDSNKEVPFMIAELQRERGSTVTTFNVSDVRYPKIKLMTNAVKFDVIHIHNLADMGKWVLKKIPTVLHYTDDEVSKRDFHVRQKDEQSYGKIIVNSPEMLELRYHSTPKYVRLNANTELMSDLYRIYSELMVE